MPLLRLIVSSLGTTTMKQAKQAIGRALLWNFSRLLEGVLRSVLIAIASNRARLLNQDGFLQPTDSFSLINDPRNEYSKLYTVDKLGNVWGGRPVLCTSSVSICYSLVSSYFMCRCQHGDSKFEGCRREGRHCDFMSFLVKANLPADDQVRSSSLFRL